jgi:hypothetical protein
MSPVWLALALAGASEPNGAAPTEPTEPTATVAAPTPPTEPAAPVTLAVGQPTAAAPHTFEHRWGDDWRVWTQGSMRYLLATPPELQVNADGDQLGQSTVFDHRMRAGLGLSWKTLAVQTEWDLASGQVAGDTWDIPGTVDTRRRDTFAARTGDGVIPRRASIGFKATEGIAFEAGLMPATNWGLGLLANGGDRDALFGRVDRGDRMLRVRTTFMPVPRDPDKGDKGKGLPLFFTIAFDKVVEDDLAHWGEQEAYQVIASALWNDPSKTGSYGVFYTFRTQTEPGATDRPTNAHVIDGFAAYTVRAGATTLALRAEGVGIFGETERVLSFANDGPTRVKSGAGALEADLTVHELVSLHLRTGATSATGDPDAGVLSDFTADSNYNVGMVLFDEVMGAVEAATYAQLADPDNAGQPPSGADLLVSEGSVRRAAWLQKAVVVRPTPWLDLRAGGVLGWSTGPISQAFYTFRAGGTPHNHLDQPTDGHFLGGELDYGVGFGRGPATSAWWFRPELRLEVGHAFLGKNLGGGVATSVLLTTFVSW